MELPKAYDPKLHEQAANDAWRASGYANPDKLPGKRKEAYSIAMPPPNATGILHIGHAVMIAIEDILIRFERMRGKKTLWIPGTDHAAIATQNVVEQELKKEGKTKHDLGREQFLVRVDEFVKNSQGMIKKQIERMGASCDWSRERFTLDEGMTNAVNHAFMEFYNDGLIYRGPRIVNWDPVMQSSVSDDEIEWKEETAPFYYLQYGPFVIGTARPETKFGDKYIVVHPNDDRYKQYHDGQTFDVEWINGRITATLIKDDAIDREFGTGAMTITPWHDATDFAIAERHKLPKEQIIDFNGKLLPIAGDFAGLHIKKARVAVVERLKEKGLVVRTDEKYTHRIARNYRGGGTIEPQIKKQWFIAVDKPTKKLGGKTLKERMLQVVDKNEITFVPQRFENVYRQWIENLHDWCISRQIWYGHRFPIWRKRMANGEWRIEVGEKPKGEEWEQDPDTLDTWFSSGLWTFSTLGWPTYAETATEGKPGTKNDLAKYHPTSVMETGYDIIFFWVTRMILMSTYFLGEVPFKNVYLHGLVRDEKGRKMSKSLNNGIDPLAMADKYGADAVRLALVIGTTPGNDQKLSEQKIAGYRNYANKLWNIGRFIQIQSEDNVMPNRHSHVAPGLTRGLASFQHPGKILKQVQDDRTRKKLHIHSLADRWIVSRLNTLIDETTKHIEKFEFSQAGEKIYDFAWHDFADWYLEITKIEGNVSLAYETFGTILKLLHPFMPFVTETLWKELGYGKDLLMIAEWPKADMRKIDGKAEKEFIAFQERVTAERKEKGKAFNLRDALS